MININKTQDFYDEIQRRQMIENRLESEISVTRANSDIPCKTCKHSVKLFTGEELLPEDFDAGSCIMYDIKPPEVYFDAKPCPKYCQQQ